MFGPVNDTPGREGPYSPSTWDNGSQAYSGLMGMPSLNMEGTQGGYQQPQGMHYSGFGRGALSGPFLPPLSGESGTTSSPLPGPYDEHTGTPPRQPSIDYQNEQYENPSFKYQ